MRPISKSAARRAQSRVSNRVFLIADTVSPHEPSLNITIPGWRFEFTIERFFFGGRAYDEWYLEEMEDFTIEVQLRVLTAQDYLAEGLSLGIGVLPVYPIPDSIDAVVTGACLYDRLIGFATADDYSLGGNDLLGGIRDDINIVRNAALKANGDPRWPTTRRRTVSTQNRNVSSAYQSYLTSSGNTLDTQLHTDQADLPAPPWTLTRLNEHQPASVWQNSKFKLRLAGQNNVIAPGILAQNPMVNTPQTRDVTIEVSPTRAFTLGYPGWVFHGAT